MANVTIVIQKDVLKRARLKAIARGTSVNAVLREYLAQYAGGSAAQVQGVAQIRRLARESGAKRGRRVWLRDELHER